MKQYIFHLSLSGGEATSNNAAHHPPHDHNHNKKNNDKNDKSSCSHRCRDIKSNVKKIPMAILVTDTKGKVEDAADENKSSITCTYCIACTAWFFPQHRGSSISSCAKSPRMFKFADLFLNTSILSDRGRTLCECKSCAILRRHLDGETLRSAG